MLCIVTDGGIINHFLHNSGSESRASSVFALNSDIPIHQLSQLLNYIQAQTGSLDIPVTRLVQPLE